MRTSRYPVTSGSAAAARDTTLAGASDCPSWPYKATSCHVCPKRAGLATASEIPAENVSAASTPSTPATAPTIAGRTGTADRPRPASSAKLAPITAGTGRPAVTAADTTGDLRECSGARAALRAAHAMTAAAAVTSSTAAAQPTPSTSQSASIPGFGSVREASPIGIQPEATIAPPTPSVAPATAASAGPNATDDAACHRVSPTARSTSSSAIAAEAYLATLWPTRIRAASSAASPNASRQAASYSLTLLTGPPNTA